MKPHIYMRHHAWWIQSPRGTRLGPYFYWPMVLDVAELMKP